MAEEKDVTLIKVDLEDGKMNVHFGQYNLALISHGIRLANLELDNMIIGQQKPPVPEIQIPQTVLDKMRGGNGRKF